MRVRFLLTPWLLVAGAWLGGLPAFAATVSQEPSVSAPGDYAVLPFPADGRMGSQTDSRVVELPDGSLIGSSAYGGRGRGAFGVVYRITSDHRFRALHQFSNATRATEGGLPSGLTLGADGLIYGVTATGGAEDCGTIFRMTTEGADYRVLHHFGCYGPEWHSWLVQMPDGDFYGATHSLLFKFTLDGTFTPIEYTIWGSQGMFLASNGLLYGVGQSVYGMDDWIYQVVPGDRPIVNVITVLPSLGTHPYGASAPPVERDGWLYGVTLSGGAYDEGVVYRIDMDGRRYREIVQFDEKRGTRAAGPLLLARDGMLYGVATSGGGHTLHSKYGDGTLFLIDGSEHFHRIHSFGARIRDGWGPGNSLTQLQDGRLVGTTSFGGGPGDGPGTVFSYEAAEGQ